MFKVQEVLAKTGELITIREAVTADAVALRTLKLSYVRGTTTIPMYADEYKNDDAAEAVMIAEYQQSSNRLILLAEFDGQLIGNIDLTGHQRRKLAHTGMIGMGIHNDWQGRGIGSMLLQAALEWAVDSPLKIVWLEVYATNLAGRSIYEKCGFQTIGTMPNFINENGQFIDKIVMQMEVGSR
ncbi:MAG: N-acetyltransferase family protein [Saprospiraceae bacterium]